MFTTDVLEPEVAKITESVFATMLGIEIHRSSERFDSGRESKMTGVVTVSGAWSGAITVTCSYSFAKKIAGTMFGSLPAATTEAEMDDAMGELANMIGGNFKSMVPAPAALSLPAVAVGTDFTLRLPGCAQVGTYCFRAGAEKIGVVVLEHA